MPINSNQFVNWFRDSSPYIHAHRNKTFVIFFSGETVLDDCYNLIHDFALLKSLGIRLVLVHGIRPQINQRLNQQNITPGYHQNLRITDDTALQCVKEAAGLVRVEIEALLSMGLANSPMAGAKIKVASGNYVIARPIGILDGIDLQHTGTVRRIDHAAIHQQLDQDSVILISPVGYSPSGEIFNLSAEQLATETAIALNAEKLIFLTEESCLEDNQVIQQMTVSEVEDYLNNGCSVSLEITLRAVIKSCQQGVQRVHLIERHTDGALLLELFTRDGKGTLISSNPYEEMRPATLSDIAGILELIKPLELQGLLVKRSREKLEMEIENFTVIERDGLVIACIALHLMKDQKSAEIACLAVHKDYQKSSRGHNLINHLLDKAKSLQLETIFVLSTQTMHWFIEKGFQTSHFEDIPDSLKEFYNYKRNSKILFKEI